MMSSANQTIQEAKEEFENQIFDLTVPLLERLYSSFVKIPEQKDKPDAAILLSNPPKRFGTKEPVIIGIEITSVDPGWYLAYTNDTKYGADLMNARVDQALYHGIVADSPTKKIDVPIPQSYIFDGVKDKAKKYESYKAQEKFDELILVCFSDVLCVGNSCFQYGVAEWTNYLLSQDNFPFDKVVFLGLGDQVAVKIYDKKMKSNKRPAPYQFPGEIITCSLGPTITSEAVDNMGEKLFGIPLVSPRPRNNK